MGAVMRCLVNSRHLTRSDHPFAKRSMLNKRKEKGYLVVVDVIELLIVRYRTRKAQDKANYLSPIIVSFIISYYIFCSSFLIHLAEVLYVQLASQAFFRVSDQLLFGWKVLGIQS
jgi:hypothetical protein